MQKQYGEGRCERVESYEALAKMLGIKNDYAQQYEEEIGKYTVVPPEYQDEENDTDGINWNDILGVQEDGS